MFIFLTNLKNYIFLRFGFQLFFEKIIYKKLNLLNFNQ